MPYLPNVNGINSDGLRTKDLMANKFDMKIYYILF